MWVPARSASTFTPDRSFIPVTMDTQSGRDERRVRLSPTKAGTGNRIEFPFALKI